ncbi:siderophore-interacting protein [Vibrio sp. SM6]|uniref:Siderophore-interacting protein n=1 Tax=Vibrio agarilyticus TaxID=2726741 RepID=A0A7X8TTI0_9VIBR|nr:siderophore-interacting protein [Vibrio agarilyticus]NLS14505.1 siderophore-interacting protein [Vibrio agarilyticus]
MANTPQNRAKQPKKPTLVTVKSVEDLSSGLRRICFISPELHHYPEACGGAHIKLMMPHGEQEAPVLPVMTEKGPRWEDPTAKPLIRTFSLRALRREVGELDIEFALHGDSGPATRFALFAQSGDVVAISGPGGPTPMLKPAQRYYMAGDLTALPAISAMLEAMPADSVGYIAILVPEQSATVAIAHPENVKIEWVIGSATQSHRLTDAFLTELSQLEQNAQLDVTQSYFWFGGEESIIVPLRNYAKRELKAERSQIYAVPYWRYGKDEDAYHQTRHAVIDEANTEENN